MRNCLLLFVTLLLFAACSEDKNYLEISSDSVFNIDNNEHLIRVAIQSDSEWDVANDYNWYSATKITHEDGDSLLITVQTNIARQKRSGELTLSNKDKRLTLSVNQAAATGEYHFKLPVIFHVLYTDASDTKQNLVTSRLYKAIEEVNRYYNGSNVNSVDMNLEFVLATHDPNGKLLPEPGINRVHRENINMNCEDVLYNKYDDARWLWDQNKYINVLTFRFTEKGVTGVSFLPYTGSANPLEGLKMGDDYYTSLPKKFAQCICVNNVYAYAYKKRPAGDISVFSLSLAHELGHYLGLYHPFSVDEVIQTDYCADTPDYVRTAYQKWKSQNPQLTLAELYKRTARDGSTFESTNIMDYDYGWSNCFTPNQRARVRHVLENSPLIPGPKIHTSIARGTGITEPGIIMR